MAILAPFRAPQPAGFLRYPSQSTLGGPSGNGWRLPGSAAFLGAFGANAFKPASAGGGALGLRPGTYSVLPAIRGRRRAVLPYYVLVLP